jgi:carboxyl-terminal processing protease
MPFSSDRPRTVKGLIGGLVLLVAVFASGWITGFERGREPGTGRPTLAALWRGDGASSTGRVLGVGGNPPAGLVQDVDFTQFWEVWRDLKSHYYRQPVDEKTLFYGALRGLADSVDDPYTSYFEPVEAEEFTNDLKGEFSGIGAEIGSKDGELQVITPLPDSPAERAGIRPRDLIFKINDEDSIDMPVDVAVSKIRGPKGTQVHLQLGRVKNGSVTGTRREFEPVDVTITREVITVKSVRVKSLDHGIVMIEIRNFNDDTEKLFRDAVDEALSKNAKGIIVDLRNDPGGYLDRAISVAGEWLKDQVVVQQRERGEITERYKGTGRGRLKGMKTVVLVNEGSASAAEIVAGALQDTGVATLVGAKTFGKGSVQDYQEYEDGSALKVTIAEWLTPNGRSINHEGIQPDVAVELTADDINAERDPQLEKAVELLRTGQAKP